MDVNSINAKSMILLWTARVTNPCVDAHQSSICTASPRQREWRCSEVCKNQLGAQEQDRNLYPGRGWGVGGIEGWEDVMDGISQVV